MVGQFRLSGVARTQRFWLRLPFDTLLLISDYDVHTKC
jgi:hypothetical protein